MIGIPEAFSPTYAVARRKFLEAAAAGGLEVESHTHPLGVKVKCWLWTWLWMAPVAQTSC